MGVIVVAFAVGCDNCRRIETRALDFECAATASFRGELHLDSEATWRSFLTDRCLPDAAAAEIDAHVKSVDFDVDAVVAARGERLSNGRCIARRAPESVDVCSEGLRVIFDDVETSVETCVASSWTVILVVARSDLRDAITENVAAVDDGASFE